MAPREGAKCRWCSSVLCCCCCSKRSWSTFKGAVALTSLSVSVVIAVLMPTYRLVAVLWGVLTLITYCQLWRFTPCDKDRVQRAVHYELARYRRGQSRHRQRGQRGRDARHHQHRVVSCNESEEEDVETPSSTDESSTTRSQSSSSSSRLSSNVESCSSSAQTSRNSSTGAEHRRAHVRHSRTPLRVERSAPRSTFGLGHHQLPLSLAPSPVAPSVAARHIELYVPVGAVTGAVAATRSASVSSGALLSPRGIGKQVVATGYTSASPSDRYRSHRHHHSPSSG